MGRRRVSARSSTCRCRSRASGCSLPATRPISGAASACWSFSTSAITSSKRPDMSGDFSPEQKRYLEGFLSGLQIARAGRGLPGGKPPTEKLSGPDAVHVAAQDRVTAAGGKLNEQERWKREQHPFEAYKRLTEQAAANEFPKPADTFRWKYYGLFYVAPAQNSFMCRLRMPNGILTHQQLAGLAVLAERFGGGYAHVTTRANLQIREIEAKNTIAMIEAIQDLGLCSRGSGADNIRNV